MALATPTFAIASEPTPAKVEASACGTLVTETAVACRDWIERGLEVNCYGKLIAIEGHRKQAEGDLFREDAQDRVRLVRTCETQTEALRQQRTEKDAAMRAKSSTGPKCSTLASSLQTRCFDDLGKKKLSSTCKMTLKMLMRATAPEPEARCEFAAGMLRRPDA